MILLAIGSNLHSKYGERFQNIDAAILFLESYGNKVNKKISLEVLNNIQSLLFLIPI